MLYVFRGLPNHERNLRRLLAERLPVLDPPSTQSTPREQPMTIDQVLDLRAEQTHRLERLIRKVRPGKDPEAPLIKAAELRLKRLNEPLALQEEPEEKEAKCEEFPPEKEESSVEAPVVQETPQAPEVAEGHVSEVDPQDGKNSKSSRQKRATADRDPMADIE
eukprot:symbB.v1.2.020221.t1/scaffold1651.1/size107612/6